MNITLISFGHSYSESAPLATHQFDCRSIRNPGPGNLDGRHPSVQKKVMGPAAYDILSEAMCVVEDYRSDGWEKLSLAFG